MKPQEITVNAPASSDGLYSNYVRREPTPGHGRIISRWHGRLLQLATNLVGASPKSILEVGPGHGYFASICREAGVAYSFVDTSAAVVNKMKSLGFSAESLSLGESSPDGLGPDWIWMSHVLEHAANWQEARSLLEDALTSLRPDGRIVIVSPDIHSWKHHFWSVDWSHGYQTSLRSVIQILDDVGFADVKGCHHRNGRKQLSRRIVPTLLSLAPSRLVDGIIARERSRQGDGPYYSWKAVFGWRQVMVVGTKPHIGE